MHCAAEHEKAEPGSVLRDAAGQACSSTCGDTVAKGRDLLDGLREQLKAVAAEHALYGWQRQCATLMGGLGGPVRDVERVPTQEARAQPRWHGGPDASAAQVAQGRAS